MDKELVGRARSIIGEPTSEDEDWIIAPTSHARLYNEGAPALADILASSAVLATAEQYEESDREAVEAKDRFEKTAQRANVAVLYTACGGAMVLVVNAFTDWGFQGAALVTLGVITVVVGGLGTMWIHRIDAGNYLQAWMSVRAKAETYRLRLFELATAAPSNGEARSEMPLALLQLEYFARYELDTQISYYKNARDRHAAAAHRALALSGVAVLLAAIATGVSAILGAQFSGLAGVAALGVLGAALSSYVSRQAEVGQDARNAERYDRTADALVELSKELDNVRGAAAGGHHKPVEKLVAAVHQQLSLEHRQWLKGVESTEDSIRQLREELAKTQSGRSDEPQSDLV